MPLVRDAGIPEINWVCDDCLYSLDAKHPGIQKRVRELIGAFLYRSRLISYAPELRAECRERPKNLHSPLVLESVHRRGGHAISLVCIPNARIGTAVEIEIAFVEVVPYPRQKLLDVVKQINDEMTLPSPAAPPSEATSNRFVNNRVRHRLQSHVVIPTR